MDWIEEMTKAMEMLQNACAQNTEWASCTICPFRMQCDACEYNGIDIPAAWKL